MAIKSQGEIVLAALRRRPHTYLEMIQLRAGLSPWKRAAEKLNYGEEKIVRAENAAGLMTWKVIPLTANERRAYNLDESDEL